MLRRRILTVLLVIAVANIVVFAIERRAYTPLKVPTQSMWPTLQAGDRIGVDHHVSLKELKRGDLVVFAVSRTSTHPVKPAKSGSSKLLVKRVIALPGESAEAHKGYVVGEQFDKYLPEPYLLGKRGHTEFPFTKIGKNEIFVLGDNRDKSVDSRVFGPVPAEAVVGRVAFRYWPPNRFERF